MTAVFPGNARTLREALARQQLVVAPGVWDCITARLAADAGFSALYMSGACTAAMLGYPDYGLATLIEFAENAGRIAAAVGTPLIADADTGFGNELNVIRTVREYEARGVAAIQLEDQTFPKRCGHLDHKDVIAADAFITKIRAAVYARRNSDTLIIARSDALAVAGVEEAIRRVNDALAAGADVAFVEAPETLDVVADIPRRVRGPCLFNLARGAKSPLVSLPDLQQLGYRMVIVPGLLLGQVIGACDGILAELSRSGTHPIPVADLPLKRIFKRLGSETWDAMTRALA